MQKNLNNKIILITGTSSGFGMLTAARLASLGHTVFASMRDLNKSQALLDEVKKRGGKVELVSLDVTKISTIISAINSIREKHGHIDCLINNAGFGMGGFFEDLTQEEIRAQLEVNFFGVQNVIREVIALMRTRGQGKIINISSIAGLSTSPAFSAYNVSKWALEAFSESLYYEMKLFGVDVHLIEPGTYNTKIFHDNARYAQNFNNPQSPYFKHSQHLKTKVMNFVNKCKKNPENIAIVVEELIAGKRNSFRNFPDLETKMLLGLRRILPFKIYSTIIHKSLWNGLSSHTRD